MKDRQAAKRHSTGRRLWQSILAILAVVAVVQELRKPADQRTWHGLVAGVMPYDFRKPTMDRIRQSSWNPEGPILTPKAWGLGWTINFGALKDSIGI